MFQDTLPNFVEEFVMDERRIVIHNDSDLYSSSLFLLTKLDQKIISPEKGAIVIFDEFFSSSHEFKAFYDWSHSYNRSYKVIACVPSNDDIYTQVAIQIL